MSTRNYTSIEQSKKLLELGLPRKTADCSFRPYYYDPVEKKYLYFENRPKWEGPVGENAIPCWSLGALLEVMPKLPKVEYDIVKRQEECYVAFDDLNKQIHEDFLGDNPLEAAYSMVVWLLTNGYIKKGE